MHSFPNTLLLLFPSLDSHKRKSVPEVLTLVIVLAARTEGATLWHLYSFVDISLKMEH